jgi:hypothetical protein
MSAILNECSHVRYGIDGRVVVIVVSGCKTCEAIGVTKRRRRCYEANRIQETRMSDDSTTLPASPQETKVLLRIRWVCGWWCGRAGQSLELEKVT